MINKPKRKPTATSKLIDMKVKALVDKTNGIGINWLTKDKVYDVYEITSKRGVSIHVEDNDGLYLPYESYKEFFEIVQ